MRKQAIKSSSLRIAVRKNYSLLLVVGFAWWWTSVLATLNTRLRPRLYLRRITRYLCFFIFVSLDILGAVGRIIFGCWFGALRRHAETLT